MASQRRPKVLLFDIGGVCVSSPFQAILDYELSLGVPPGWINYSISKSAPDGFWHRLERGEIPMDKAFFDGFNQDLHGLAHWKAFYRREQAKSSSLPRELPPLPTMDGEWLFDEIMSRSSTPDPCMYPALQKLKQSGGYILGALSNTVIFPPGHTLHSSSPSHNPLRQLFDVFISSAHVGLRKPDPKIYQYHRHSRPLCPGPWRFSTGPAARVGYRRSSPRYPLPRRHRRESQRGQGARV